MDNTLIVPPLDQFQVVSQFEFFAQMHQGVQKQTETLPNSTQALSNLSLMKAQRKPLVFCSLALFSKSPIFLSKRCTKLQRLVLKMYHSRVSYSLQ
jgi:hypothetical protein